VKLFSKNTALVKRAGAGLRLGFSLFWPLGLGATTMVFSEYLKNFNYQAISFLNLRLPLVLALAVAVIVTIIFWPTYRRSRVEGLVAGVFAVAIFAANYEDRLQEVYGLIKALLPLAPPPEIEGIVISLVFMLTILLLSWLLARFINGLLARRSWSADKLIQALLVAIVFVFLSQFLPAAQVLSRAWPQFWYRPGSLLSHKGNAGSGKPDIYYLVFDRYGSQETLKHYFNFDNSQFIHFLTGQGLEVRGEAYSNYPFTPMSISSTLLANYHSDISMAFGNSLVQTDTPFQASIKFSPVVSELKSLGYEYHHLSSNYQATNTAPLADKAYNHDGQLKVFGRRHTVDVFSQGRLHQSPLLRFLQYGLLGFQYSDNDGHELLVQQLETLDKLAGETAGGRFIFAHMLLPHDPFFFNADGSLSTNVSANNIGQRIEDKYLGQVGYVNRRLYSLIEQINRKSESGAVIVLQADEGPYPSQFINHQFDPKTSARAIQLGDMREWEDEELKMKYGILAAYHLPGVPKEDLDAGADPVNIFRLVFNHYFGYQLPYLPRCQFALPQGTSRAATFTDVTERITGQTPDPRCSELITSEN
jgi:hypothetical protein